MKQFGLRFPKLKKLQYLKLRNNVDCLDFIVICTYLPSIGPSCPGQGRKLGCKVLASSRDTSPPRATVSLCSHDGSKPQCSDDSCRDIKCLHSWENTAFLFLMIPDGTAHPGDTQDAGCASVMALSGKLGEDRRLAVFGRTWRACSWWKKGRGGSPRL